MSWFSPLGNWFGQKAFKWGLKSMRNIPRDYSHPEQSKARDAIQANMDAQALRTNNDLVASFTKALQSGVVGTGFTLQYKSEDEVLNKEVEAFLSHWSEYGNCEITGRFFRQDLERFMVSEGSVVGGFIIRHHWDKKLPTLYNSEILSTTTIDRTKNNFIEGLYFGVQTDKLGRISGIHIYDDAQRMSSKLHSMKYLTLFIDIWTDPHQYTNVTPLAPTLNTLDKLATYDDAEVKNAKQRSEKSIIIATEAYAIMLEAQKEYMNNPDLKETEKKAAQEEYMELLASFSAPGLHNGATPIMPGENTKVWDLKQTGDTVYADINQNSKQIFSRGLGLSASTIAGLPESSYNVALKNAQGDEREYAIVGQKIIEKVLKKMYRNAIEAGYLLGYYKIEDYYSNKIKYDAYLKITRKQIGHIDPLKQNVGDGAAVEQGFTSVPAVIASRGQDADEVLDDEIRYEKKKKEKYEAVGLLYIQSGTEGIALAEAKEAAKQQDIDESKTKEEEK